MKRIGYDENMSTSKKKMAEFKNTIWSYYQNHRRDFPWRRTRNPYHILVSEIMLQQTQAARVIETYKKFIRDFPHFQALATSPLQNILAVWQGLGYNRRALFLKKTASLVVKKYNGALPRSYETLIKLPGIGPSTAGAVLAFAFEAPRPFIETNIRRAFIHFFFSSKRKVSDAEILPLVTSTLKKKNPREWFYALMDYGALLGKTVQNPNQKSAAYHVQPRFAGSDRELRGKIIKLLLASNVKKEKNIVHTLHTPPKRLQYIFSALEKEGLISRKRTCIRITS